MTFSRAVYAQFFYIEITKFYYRFSIMDIYDKNS